MGTNEHGYWGRASRLSRRRLLGVVGVAGLGLAGCATSSNPAAPTQGPAAPAAASTTGAAAATAAPAAPAPKLGGTIQTMATSSEAHLDPHMPGGPNVGCFGPAICWSQLLNYKLGKDIKPTSYTVVGDLAESWQQLDDL